MLSYPLKYKDCSKRRARPFRRGVVAVLVALLATSGVFAQLHHFKVEAAGGGNIGKQRAGAPFSIRITAQKTDNTVATTFTGKAKITSTGLITAGGDSTAKFTAGVLTAHSVTIGNTGNFTITATNVSTGTSNGFAVVAFMSDDFNAGNVNTRFWTFSDPLGDAVISLKGTGTTNARLSLELPAGVAHDLFTGKNLAPRLMQPAANVDFTLEVKFDSPVSQVYQIQGVLVQQSASTLLRFDLSSDGTSTNAYAASTMDGFATAPVTQIPLTAVAPNNVSPLYMRVSRVGNVWNMYSSTNGTSYSLVGSFTFALTVGQAGLFAGNGGTSVPGHVALVDYFFDTASPIAPEDGVAAIDSLPPLVYDMLSIAGGTAIKVSWKTDERSKSRLQYGKTTAYGSTVIDDTLRTLHTILLPSLSSNTVYNFRIIATDSLGLKDTTGNLKDTTYVKSPTLFAIWYGNTQTFGKIGTSQRFVNVLGNVWDPVGIDSLFYRLNAGPQVNLSRGPDSRRLQNPGDFNIDIRYDALRAGSNTVALTAKNPFGERKDTTITVKDSSAAVWPLPFAVTWSSQKSLTDSVQIPDGKWAVSSGKIRVVERGYDRILAFGDTTWQDYVMKAKVTVTGFDSSLLAYSSPSNGPSIAMLMRWKGHTSDPIGGTQPLAGYLPLGGYAALSWPTVNSPKWELFGNNLVLKEARLTPVFQFDTTYFFKMQVTTIPGQGGFYRFKVWKASETEPSTWLLNAQEPLSGPQRGAALLVAHHVSALIDDVIFTALPADNIPPIISNVNAEAAGTSAFVTLGTDEPARTRIEYGLTTAYAGTALADSTLRLSHGVPLTGLRPSTTYHYRIIASDNSGNAATTADAVFTTLLPPIPTTLVSDEFNAAALDPRWIPVNPLGDAAFSTPDTVVRIAVPGQVGHDIWTDGYRSPRIMQAANNTDVQVDVKWNSAITGTSTEYRTQGILAEQDANNLVRFDYSSNPAETYVFAASFSNGFTPDAVNIQVYRPAPGATGTQPLYMRVKREGNVWTQWYSTDGTTWALASRFYHRLTLSGVGLFAANAGTAPPSHTAIVDYFRVNSLVSDVAPAPAIPAAFALEQNYPNPFNPATTIRYGLPHKSAVQLTVYNMLGQQVVVLVQGEQEAGYHDVKLDCSGYSSGVYFYRLQAGGFVDVKKLVLVR
jgi:hypothetical protein